MFGNFQFCCWIQINLFVLIQTGIALGEVTKCYQCGSAESVADNNCSDDNVKSKYSPTTCPAVGGLTYKYCTVSEYDLLHSWFTARTTLIGCSGFSVMHSTYI